jgi:hypothetical protein
MVRQRIRWDDYQRYLKDPERPAFLQELRSHEIGGRPIADVLDSITETPFDGLRSVAAGLHGRLGKEPAPARGDTTTWAERTGQATPVIREADAGLDRRQAELGGQLAAEPGALREDWMQRAALVESYRELAGITDPAVAIGLSPSRQAGMSEAFAASVRALELPDDAALVKAMGRGELEASVREYARAEAVAPADVRPQIDLSDGVRQDSLDRAEAARKAGNEALARSAEALAQRLDAERDRLQVADAARLEWEEATATKAEAASAARAELEARGPARWDQYRPEPQAIEVPEAQAAEPAVTLEHEARAETTAGIDEAEAGQEIGHVEPAAGAGAWPEAQAEMAADVDPEALTVMASADATMAAISRSEFDDNLARAQAGAEQLAARRAHDQAERDRAAIDEPVSHAEVDASLEATAAADKAEADDVDLEI